MRSPLYQIQNGKPKLIAYASKMVTSSSKKLFHYRVRIMWFSHKHSQFFSLIKKSRF